jgi:hypothetical protein
MVATLQTLLIFHGTIVCKRPKNFNPENFIPIDVGRSTLKFFKNLPRKKAGPGTGLGPKDPLEKIKMHVSYTISLDVFIGTEDRPGPTRTHLRLTRTDQD